MSILENIGAGIVSVALFIGGLFGYSPEPVYAPDIDAPDEQALGADTVAYFGGQTYTLAGTGISSTASSFTLTSFTITQNGKKIQDSEMADTFYLTFEPGSRARQEFASCTTVVQNSDGTATISGCTRGLSPVTPYTASSSLQFAHGGGTSVIFSNTPQFYDQFTAKGNDEAITGDWTVPVPATNDSIANKAYVLSAITGTSTIATDKVQVGATAGETFATGTVVFFQESDQRWYKLDVDNEAHYVDREIGIANGPGSAGVNISGGVTVRGLVTTTGLTAGANYFASSTAGATSTATTSQPIGVARSTTQLYFNPDLIDSTVYATTSFSSSVTFGATATFNATTTGTLGSSTVRYYTATSTWTKPQYLKYITVWVCGAGGSGAAGNASSDSGAGGGAGGCGFEVLDYTELAGTSSVQVGVQSTVGSASSFGNFCTATGGTSAVATVRGAGGTATGCDRNVTGAGGTGGWAGASADLGGAPGGGSALSPGGGGGSPNTGSGDNGSDCGAGGGGGAGSAGSGNGSGGTGAGGCVIITEYF